MESKSLVERCREGDQVAWRLLVDRYAGFAFAIARAHHLPEDACEDVVQTCFASLARHLPDLQEDRGLVAWIRTTVTRECWRTARRMRRAPNLPAGREPQVQAESDPAERMEMHQRLRLAMEDVGERCRELLSALYFSGSGSDYDGIAARLGIPRGSLGPTRARCLQKLAEMLSEQG